MWCFCEKGRCGWATWTYLGNLGHLYILPNGKSSYEHVPEDEWYVRTIKERVRCTINTLPFKNIPHSIIVVLVYSIVLWPICFPHLLWKIPKTIPRTINTGHLLDYSRHCSLEFGSYVKVREKPVHEQHDMRMVWVKKLALRPTGNSPGRYNFYELNISHVNSKVDNEIFYLLEEALLTKTRGNVHDYLWMNLFFHSFIKWSCLCTTISNP